MLNVSGNFLCVFGCSISAKGLDFINFSNNNQKFINFLKGFENEFKRLLKLNN